MPRPTWVQYQDRIKMAGNRFRHSWWPCPLWFLTKLWAFYSTLLCCFYDHWIQVVSSPSPLVCFFLLHRHVPCSLRVWNLFATLIWFSQTFKAVALGVAAVTCRPLLGYTAEGWVSGGDQRWMSCLGMDMTSPTTRGTAPTQNTPSPIHPLGAMSSYNRESFTLCFIRDNIIFSARFRRREVLGYSTCEPPPNPVPSWLEQDGRVF